MTPFRATNVVLTENEARVLGSLVEKDITTPDYYPLTLNALVNACNQKSNREPVMNLNEEMVRQALHSLNEKGLSGTASAADSRVPKFEHRMQEAFNFTRRETAVMCVLMLRGPQTPGELRGRTERMHRFEDLTDVQSTLQKLMTRETEPLVKVLPRQPGTKEARYAHLLSGDKPEWDAPPAPIESRTENSADGERLAALEEEVAGLKRDMAELKQELAGFREQFE
ncbi:MAG: DUF480 domain-containing protein [Acidobacteria bacterium]|nr:MAG: DUF480 domain-containing protein [Acidobacteriota bacterium]